MSHEISIRGDGRAEMAYVGDVPWHGLGQSLAVGASIEEWIAAAGMDWRICRSRVRYATSPATATDAGTWGAVDDRVVLLRSDTKAALGIVSDDYQLVQPRAVVEFFRDLTESLGFTMETAGVLFGGKRFWALAATGDSGSIADPADKVKGYLMLSTSSDGSLATEGRYTTVRVVCHNTLSLARRDDAAKVRISHRSAFCPATVKAELGIEQAQSRFDLAMADFRRMADAPISGPEVIENTGRVFVPGWSDMKPEDKARAIARATSPVQAVARLAIDGTARGAALDGVEGTVWGWLNACTEYVDHAARAKTTDNRLNSAWFGNGAAVKQAAYEQALMLADGTTKYVPMHRRPVAEPSDDGAGLLDSVLLATTAA